MNRVKRILFLTAMAAAIPVANAHAADLDIPIINDIVPEYKPVEIGSGWYLRGDITYSVAASGGSAGYRTFAGGIYGSDVFDTSDIEADWGISAGVGYVFNNWMRADVTVERFAGSFAGTTSDANPCDPAYTAGTTCASNDTAGYQGYSFMANAYADLGTVKGLTPYAGAGIGMTALRWGGLNNTLYCVDGGVACGAGDVPITTLHPGETDWRLTWALMAGVSYDLTKNMKLDLGYRYRRIEGGNFFGFDAATAAAGATGVQAVDSGIDSHDIKVGFRYEIW